jgi:hypothetical protein
MLFKQLQYSTFYVDVFYHNPTLNAPRHAQYYTMVDRMAGNVEIMVLWVSMPYR